MLVRGRLTRPGVSVLIGGVSELFQRDLDLGRLAVARLQGEDLGPGVLVEDLHYGAVAVAQRLAELRPEALVLVSAVGRGRLPGTVERRWVDAPSLTAEQAQAAVGDAVTGYVHPDLVLEVAATLGALPRVTISVEVEPEVVGPGEGLSASAAAGLEAALDLVRAEARRAPVLALAEQVAAAVAGSRLEESTGLVAMRALLADLDRVRRNGRWGATFVLRDRVRDAVASTPSSEGMDHRDWGLWWTLIEELDRLQKVEAG